MKTIRITFKDGLKVIVRHPKNVIWNIHENNA